MENGRMPNYGVNFGGAGRVRTDDPLLAKQVLYQLSYDPKREIVFKERYFEIYFVRSTETRRLAPPSTIDLVTEVTRAVSLKRR